MFILQFLIAAAGKLQVVCIAAAVLICKALSCSKWAGVVLLMLGFRVRVHGWQNVAKARKVGAVRPQTLH